MMKYFRSIAMVLIIALASSPALAAVCATSCASQKLMSSIQSDSMAGMKDCHQSSINKNKNKNKNNSNTEHKSCTMGAGCHFTQLTTLTALSSNIKLVDSTTITFPKFAPFAKSIDLSPPLKPPA